MSGGAAGLVEEIREEDMGKADMTIEAISLNDAGEVMLFEDEDEARAYLEREVEHNLKLFTYTPPGTDVVECSCGWSKELGCHSSAQEIAAAVREHMGRKP